MNFKDENLRVLNFTHFDMDGVVSGIVIKNYYKKVDVQSLNYGKEKEALDYATNHLKDYDVIIFTDFTPFNLGMFQKIGKPVLVLDHHESVLKFNNPQNNVYISTKYCGAMMAYKYFNTKGTLDYLSDLVNIANDFDMWILKDNRSMFFNAMMFEMGFNWFMHRFIKGNTSLYPEEKEYLKEYVADYKKFYDELPLSELSNKGAFVEADKYLAEISRDLRKDGYNWVIIKHGTSLSVRSNLDEIDLTNVATILRRGGGHKKAIGIKMIKDIRTEVMELERAVETTFSASEIDV